MDRYIGLREEDIWIFRLDSQVITSLSCGYLEPTETITSDVSAEYRGVVPVRVLGFYLRPIPELFYNGEEHPEDDIYQIIKWSDNFKKDIDPPGVPGIELIQVDWETEEGVVNSFNSTQGFAPHQPIPYIGAETPIVHQGEQISFSVRVNMPSDTLKEVVQARRYHVGIGIVTSKVVVDYDVLNVGSCP